MVVRYTFSVTIPYEAYGLTTAELDRIQIGVARPCPAVVVRRRRQLRLAARERWASPTRPLGRQSSVLQNALPCRHPLCVFPNRFFHAHHFAFTRLVEVQRQTTVAPSSCAVACSFPFGSLLFWILFQPFSAICQPDRRKAVQATDGRPWKSTIRCASPGNFAPCLFLHGIHHARTGIAPLSLSTATSTPQVSFVMRFWFLCLSMCGRSDFVIRCDGARFQSARSGPRRCDFPIAARS